MVRFLIPLLAFPMLWSIIFLNEASANAKEPSGEEIMQQRMDYYMKYQDVFVPWHYLAAVDQYERNIQ
ncbi:peptidase M23, partial [Butyricicoccus sp. 1XD8-22]